MAPGMAAEEVERLVTYPVEQSLMGLPGAEGVRSVSKSGLSLVTVPFPDRMDIYFARTLVQQRLGDAQGAAAGGRGAAARPRLHPDGRAVPVHGDERLPQPGRSSRRSTTTPSARGCAPCRASAR